MSHTERCGGMDGGHCTWFEAFTALIQQIVSQPDGDPSAARQLRRELAIATIPHITIKGSPIAFLADLAEWVETGEASEPEVHRVEVDDVRSWLEAHGPVGENLRAQLAEANAAAALVESRLEKLVEAARIHVRMDGQMDPATVLDVLGAKPWADDPGASFDDAARASQRTGAGITVVDLPEADQAVRENDDTWARRQPGYVHPGVVPIEPLHPGDHSGFATAPRQETPDAR